MLRNCLNASLHEILLHTILFNLKVRYVFLYRQITTFFLINTHRHANSVTHMKVKISV